MGSLGMLAAMTKVPGLLAGEAAGAVIVVMSVGLATASRVVAEGDSGDGGSDTGCRVLTRPVRRAVCASWMTGSGLGIRSCLGALCEPFRR